MFAARTVSDPQALHLLGITLLVVSGSAFVLLAQYQQVFHPMLFASVAMLFIVIPMMSWGLGEALAVTLLVYTMFTLSTLDAKFDFADQSLWTLQFIMLGASAVSLSLVVRNVKLRKHDISTQHDLVVAHEQITELSNRDPLTGAWNRRYFDLKFEKYLQQCRENQNQFHFMLLDIDDFKRYNDRFGHLAGDALLREISQSIVDSVRRIDVVSRFGGEEFAILSPETTAEEAFTVGERVRQSVLNHSFTFNGQKEMGKISLSVGIATFPGEASNLQELKHWWQRVGTDAYSMEEGLLRFETYQVLGEDALIIHETFSNSNELKFHLTKGTAERYKKEIDRIAAPEAYFFRGPVAWTIRTYSKFMHLPATYSSLGSNHTRAGGSMSDGTSP